MGKKKVDQGFELIYWNLSYRRKFIRTLWMGPFCIIALLMVWDINRVFTIILSIVMLILFFVQLMYNYWKWKERE